MLTFPEARQTVVRTVRASRLLPATEHLPLHAAAGRVLAASVAADRDLPPLSRSIRDGYAVCASTVPGELEVIGEVRAGERHAGRLKPGQAIEIMTGAPIPDGADAVVMVEHARRLGARVALDAPAQPGQFINPRGCEAAKDDVLLHPGKRLDFADIALLATVGCSLVPVYRRPRVAIVSTGDEIVEVSITPREFQIRNSNAWALAALVERAGGSPDVLPVARDTLPDTRNAIRQALTADMVLLSGGVSAGKYDLVEQILAEFGAEVLFDQVLIQPGKPVVFARVGEKYLFGLPGNPAATIVTFEVLARAALELLAAREDSPLHLPLAHLTCDFRHAPGLTRFLPASVSIDGGEVTPIFWHGSSDIPSLAQANAFLVADPDRAEYARGELIRIYLK